MIPGGPGEGVRPLRREGLGVRLPPRTAWGVQRLRASVPELSCLTYNVRICKGLNFGTLMSIRLE